MPEYHVYVLRNIGGRKYIGLSEDLSRRLHEHNTGVSRWTRAKGPWALVWESKGLPLSDARKLESLLKRQKGGNGFYLITGLPVDS